MSINGELFNGLRTCVDQTESMGLSWCEFKVADASVGSARLIGGDAGTVEVVPSVDKVIIRVYKLKFESTNVP